MDVKHEACLYRANCPLNSRKGTHSSSDQSPEEIYPNQRDGLQQPTAPEDLKNDR